MSRHRASCVALSFSAFLVFGTPAFAGDSKNYVPWPMDEYEFFGLSKDDLAKQYKNKLIFNEDLSRGNLDKSSLFLFTFSDGKVSAVQRLTLSSSRQEYYGPMFKSKKSALEYARIGRELASQNSSSHAKVAGGKDSLTEFQDKRFKELGKMLRRRHK